MKIIAINVLLKGHILKIKGVFKLTSRKKKKKMTSLQEKVGVSELRSRAVASKLQVGSPSPCGQQALGCQEEWAPEMKDHLGGLTADEE